MMYQIIKDRPNIYNLYKDKLIKEGSFDSSYVKNLWDKKYQELTDAFNESRN